VDVQRRKGMRSGTRVVDEIHFARCCAGEDIAARCPYHKIKTLPPIFSDLCLDAWLDKIMISTMHRLTIFSSEPF
jgi:hypothetical protein